ncbi:MAG: hypothetical protein JW889_09635 [Verrucomicrobia bacterium]|nr:hypothetical protein [Verrucomicrobiota bacterium]
MRDLKLTPRTRTSYVMRSVPDFDRVLRRERQFNLLRIIHELPNARQMPWWTVCRVAGLTEIEIRLLNDVLAEEARDSVQAA